MINPNSNTASHNELSFNELANVSGGSPVIETLIQIGISAAYDYLKDTGVLEAVNPVQMVQNYAKGRGH